MNSTLSITTDVKTNDTPQSGALIDQYEPQSDVFFASPSQTVLGKPPFANVLLSSRDDIAEQAKQSLRFAMDLGIPSPIVIGAINFSADTTAYLRVAHSVTRISGREAVEPSPVNPSPAIHDQPPTVSVSASGETFARCVQSALNTIKAGPLQKVVLSRTLKVRYPSTPNSRQLLKNLYLNNPKGYTFGLNLRPLRQRSRRTEAPDRPAPQTAPDFHAMVGASPELLIAKTGKYITAHPLAGSEPRSHVPATDAERIKRLNESKKDQREHALVVDAIKAALTPFCKTLNVPARPSLVETPTMLHLGTVITGELKEESTSSLALALALHPTPAVCGQPMALAKRVIEQLEAHDRHLYTGMVGWCDHRGDGEWAVTIRCAEIKDAEVTLYAGAGIVEGSCPDKELDETSAKFNTLLNAMGVLQ